MINITFIMNRLGTIFLLIICLCYTQVIAQWRTIDTKIDTIIVDLCFPDTLNGWAITPNKIFHSSNGGDTWTVQNHTVDSVNFRKIFFVNKKVGYIVGYSGIILSTKDGGNQWVQQNGDMENLFLLTDVYFIDENNGWITGLIDNADNRGGVILNTTDGGNTWQKQIERKDGIGYYAVKFIDKDNGWAFSSYGWDNFDDSYISRTYNGGKNWDTIGTIQGIPVFTISMTSADTIWAGGFGYSRSFNGGVDWDNNSFIEEFPGDTTYWKPFIFEDLLKLDGKEGYAIISRLRSGNKFTPLLYYTNDGGLHWNFSNLPDNFEAYRITTIDKYIYVTSINGLMATNKLVTSVKRIPPSLSFKLYQNYPNPFNPSTTISYELIKGEGIKLIIYNVQGEKVKTLVNEFQNKGIHNIVWRGDNDYGQPVTSGVYFIQLNIKNKSLTKKAILIH